MARKRKFGRKNLYVKDWLDVKPYNVFGSYDKWYVELANKLFKLLHEYSQIFDKLEINTKLRKELAVILTSYFEDYINEIGIWEAFVKTNKDLYGFHLPFFETKEYDPEYLNPEDFAYLIWHFLNQFKGKLLSPDQKFFTDISGELYNLTEPLIDEAPLTEFYNSYLSIPDDIYFFELKSRLVWFATESYIPGFEGRRRLFEAIEKYQEKSDNYANNPAMLNQIEYSMQGEYLYKKCFTFSALSTLEWFTKIIDASPSTKQTILDLEKWVLGTFFFESHDDTYYFFRSLQDDKLIPVHKESVKINTKDAKKGDLCTFTLVKWQEDWWLTGSFFNFGKPKPSDLEKFKNEKRGPSFYLYPKETQQQLIEMNEIMHRNFMEYFRNPIAFYKDKISAQMALNDFFGFCQSEESKKKKVISERENKGDKHSKLFSHTDLVEEEGMAIIFIKGIGIALSPDLPNTVSLMKKKHLNQKEASDLIRFLFHGATHPQTVRFLLKNYPTKNIRFPVEIPEKDILPYSEFLMRYLNPDDFSEAVPNMMPVPV